MLLQSAGFLFGDMYHSAVLGRYAILHFHAVVGELADMGKLIQICALVEAEGMGIITVDIVHQHILSIADTLPDIRGLVSASLRANRLRINLIWASDVVAHRTADACCMLMRNIKEMIFPVVFDDVAVDHAIRLIGSFQQ